jgi:hypothetical protein
LFAQSDDPLANGIPFGRGARALGRFLEKLPLRILAELMAEDAEAGVGIAEALGHSASRQMVDEECPQGLVLAVEGAGRVEEFVRELC